MLWRWLRYAGMAVAVVGVLVLIPLVSGVEVMAPAVALNFILLGVIILAIGEGGSALMNMRSTLRGVKRILQSQQTARSAPAPAAKASSKPRPVWETTGIANIGLGDGMECRMYCPNKKAYLRSTDMLTKEPGTIAWLDGMGSDGVLWDVGANIGLFTLYAAIKRKCQVVAFEPGAANYLVLNRNLELNALQERATAFCISVAQKSGLDLLYMPITDFGSAQANFGAAVDYQGVPFVPKFKQGSAGFSLDDLVSALPFPSHIKIDVDGLERQIVLGGPGLLRDERLRSALIEVDVATPAAVEEMANLMRSHGLVFVNEGVDAGKRKVVNLIFERRS